MRWVSLVLCALAACGHPAPAPEHPGGTPAPPPDATKPLDEDLPRLAARAVEMYQAQLRALTEAGKDCAAAAAKIDAVADNYADVTAANTKIAHAGHEKIKQLKAALAPHDAELDAAAQQIAAAITASNCASDPTFGKALDRFGAPS